MHPDEIPASAALVHRLLTEQFPRWARLSLRPVASAGSDNHLFRLGADRLVRLPRRPGAAEQLAKQHEWLPRWLSQLPLRVPKPLGLGCATATFPWAWSVFDWIEGQTATRESLAADASAPEQLGRFLHALQQQDTRDGPTPGPHNAFRGEPLAARDGAVRAGLAALGDSIDVARAIEVWEASLATPLHTGAPRWLHGDLLPGNVLLAEGSLVAVIDFGLMAVGDPACDLMAAWTLFDRGARARFRGAVQADDAAWMRGRGWALAFAAVALPYYRPRRHPLAEVASRTLDEVLGDALSRQRQDAAT